MKYAALCCIAKDEDLFLKEWLAYHALIGFEHFIVYDNASARPIADLLDGFAGPDRLTILRSDTERTQRVAYPHCLATLGDKFKWIAFLDLDEFIRISPGKSASGDVRELLASYEPYAALGLNWRMFSSSGHETRPSGLVIENYTHYLDDDIHIKSLVQPAKVAGCVGPHSFLPNPGQHVVNTDFFPIPGGFPASFPAVRDACINHYFYKSRECFAFKIARGNPCHIERRMEEFERHLTLPAQSDTALAAFADRVREALAADRLPLAEAPERVPVAADRLPLAEAPERVPVAAADSARAAGETDSFQAAQAFLASAREHGKKGRALQAHVCACYAALHADLARASAGEEAYALCALELWTLRASLARKDNDYARAEYFLRQALMCGASVQAYTELANVMLNTGRQEESRLLVSLIKGFPSLRAGGA